MDEGQALSSLHQILARPEYQVAPALPWWQQLLGPLLDLVWSLVSSLLQTLQAAATGREGLTGLGVLCGCLIVVAAAGVYLVCAVRLSVMAERRSAATSPAARRERSDELWRTAQRLAAAGEPGEALRHAYLSALYALDEHALLHVDSSLTNREHALRVRDASLAEEFGQLVNAYDYVRYGRAPVMHTSLTDFLQRAERIRGLTLGRRAT